MSKHPSDYDGSPVCPRCGSGWPTCADWLADGTKPTHAEACGKYQWAEYLCATCDAEVAS